MKKSEGVKHDEGKLPWELLPYDAIQEIVRVLLFGAGKYAPRNWESGMLYGRLFGALQRHLTAWWLREENDPETALNHLAHAGCCILFLLAYTVRDKTKFDNRPGPNGECYTVFTTKKGT